LGLAREKNVYIVFEYKRKKKGNLHFFIKDFVLTLNIIIGRILTNLPYNREGPHTAEKKY